MYKSTFTRYEIKYLLTLQQRDYVVDAISSRMKLDAYGRTVIRNVYYDTDTYELIRRSNEKPMYKEKLRVRSYGCADPSKPVFVELKKKYEGVVYKRRISLTEASATDWLCGLSSAPVDTQISREIDYFMSHYAPIRPAMFLSYEREAFYEMDGGDLRVTFDDNILCRRTDISLRYDAYGHQLLPHGTVLMEIKCPGAIPLWLVKILSEGKIYKTSFSKYGRAYIDTVLPELIVKKEQAKELIINA